MSAPSGTSSSTTTHAAPRATTYVLMWVFNVALSTGVAFGPQLISFGQGLVPSEPFMLAAKCLPALFLYVYIGYSGFAAWYWAPMRWRGVVLMSGVALVALTILVFPNPVAIITAVPMAAIASGGALLRPSRQRIQGGV
jgi:hypothetical protein